ncbi:MAG TPA: methyl-accepting chemotaxis protein [Cellvibrionaceae bacterium]
MNVFSSLRVSQKILLLVAWLALGFAGLGVAYYWQVDQEAKVRETAQNYNLFEKFLQQGRGHLQDFIANSYRLAADSDELRANKEAFIGAFNQAELLAKKETSLPNPHKIVSQFETVQASASTQNVSEVTPGKPRYSDDKIYTQFKVLEAIVKQRARPQELAAWVELQRLHDTFIQSHDENALNNVQGFGRDFLTTQKSVLRPDAGLTQLITALDDYLASFTLEAPPQRPVVFDGQKYLPVLQQLNELQQGLESQLIKFTGAMDEQIQLVRAIFIALIFVVVMGAAVGIYFIYKSIVFPLVHMQNVMQRINKGNVKARVKILEHDELGDLGRAFNQLLDDRFQFLQDQFLENEILNNSIISLIKAVGLIARKDLTIKVPVSADITGTISDAINLLTSETAKTLWQVKDISAQVNQLADGLQKQSRLVVQVAEDERKQVIATGKAMEISAKTMGDIAAKAQNADKFAIMAIDNTQSARDTVSRSVSGILSIRETISETEKRIKRLGDRSQEISGIVNLINTIAERTHILALNASMHAASAGEAGKGFAVVADEVQRLAENAREATAEISSMVNNIRIETADAVNTMNKLITQVAEGTRLAESAGAQMEDTVTVTKRLVEQVQHIAHSSAQQAELSNRVRDRTTIIRSFTEKTGLQLTQQKQHTDSLKLFCETLVERVNSFSLPEHEKDNSSV